MLQDKAKEKNIAFTACFCGLMLIPILMLGGIISADLAGLLNSYKWILFTVITFLSLGSGMLLSWRIYRLGPLARWIGIIVAFAYGSGFIAIFYVQFSQIASWELKTIANLGGAILTIVCLPGYTLFSLLGSRASRVFSLEYRQHKKYGSFREIEMKDNPSPILK